jgi:hypothetical protein
MRASRADASCTITVAGGGLPEVGLIIPIMIHKAASLGIRYEMSVRAFLEDHVSPLPGLVID